MLALACPSQRNAKTDRANVLAMTLQPFFNYNLDLTTSPIITANWEADSDNRWTVPIGGGIGRVFKIGSQPVKAQMGIVLAGHGPFDRRLKRLRRRKTWRPGALRLADCCLSDATQQAIPV
jgi:hypothetical protein